MEERTALKKMMLSIKLEETIPEECYPDLRRYLTQMYVVGWEAGKLQINQHTNKAIGQYDRNGNLINTYRSRIEAAKKTGFTEGGIKKSMERKRPTKQGWTWKYLPLVTNFDP